MDDGTIRVTGEEFIRQLRAAEEWRIWMDDVSTEFVLAVKIHGQIKTYKALDPTSDQANWDDLIAWMKEVQEVTTIPEIAERRR